MGLYERDYYRDVRPALSIHAPRTAIGVIILINVLIYVADALFDALGSGHWLTSLLAVHGPSPADALPEGLMQPLWWQAETLTHPWLWWQFITYGFAHSPEVQHILFNMMGLWFLGPRVEQFYGRKEFLRLYLVLLAAGSVIWAIIIRIPPLTPGLLIGASGAVTGTVVLFALNFPRQTLLLMFVLPVPAWLVGVMVVVLDMLGATGRSGSSNVAYTVHLAGAAFAFLYYQQRWNLGRLFEGRFSWPRLGRRPRLRVFQHEADENRQDELAKEVDRLLEKIHRQGEASLTRKERHTLEDASRQYQKRRRE
jgi:membrane associated rhomboid family serine protease